MAYREVTLMEIHEALRQWLTGAGGKVIARRLAIETRSGAT